MTSTSTGVRADSPESGVADAPLHPAVAPPPRALADRSGSLDRVVFGVSAVVALAFLAWGFLSPSGLGSTSGTALTWVE